MTWEKKGWRSENGPTESGLEKSQKKFSNEILHPVPFPGRHEHNYFEHQTLGVLLLHFGVDAGQELLRSFFLLASYSQEQSHCVDKHVLGAVRSYHYIRKADRLGYHWYSNAVRARLR